MARKLKAWESGRVVVFDNAVCSGCRSCETACALSHEGVVNPLFARMRVTRHKLDVQLPDIHVCAQCVDAPCAQACPKGAISQDDSTKAWVVDEEKCIGCGLCGTACIYTPPMIHVVPAKKKAIKCDLCGGAPECVSICPMGALAYKEVAQ